MAFLTPLFLLGLAAAAVPVVLHLVRRMTARKVPFSSLMFLQATPQERVRRRRLKDVLLMAVRAALVAVVALAFARPFIPQDVLPFAPAREAQSVVILVDRSLSMQAEGAFEAAKAAALERIAEAAEGDELAVIAFDDRAQPLTQLGSDLDLHRGALEAELEEPSYRPTDLFPALRLADELLASARHEQRRVVLVSDFQESAFTGALDNWTLAPGVMLEPVRVGGAADNRAIAAFNLQQRRTADGVALRYDARAEATGRLADEETDARLVVDGAVQETQTLEEGTARRLSFQALAPREGTYTGYLDLGDDALPADNRHYFTYAVAERPSVLVVDEAPSRALSGGFFLESAFALGDDARYRVERGTRGALSPGQLQQHDVVFLTAVPALSQAQAERLRDWVERGGSLVLSFGPESDLGGLRSALQTLGVGTAAEVVDARADAGAEAIVGEVDVRHPVFRVFAAGTSALLRPTFRRYVRLVPDSAATVVGRYDGGDPMLVERERGAGTVLAYTSSLSTAWTDFPIQEAYVPFVYQLVGYALARGGAGDAGYRVGETVALPGRPGDVWEVRTPDDQLLRAEVDAGGVAFFQGTDRPGHYAAANGRERRAFAVNVDPREGDLTPRDVEEAYAALVAPAEDRADTPERATIEALEEEEARQKFWRWLVLLALALFALETLLANRRLPTARTAPAEPPVQRRRQAA